MIEEHLYTELDITKADLANFMSCSLNDLSFKEDGKYFEISNFEPVTSRNIEFQFENIMNEGSERNRGWKVTLGLECPSDYAPNFTLNKQDKKIPGCLRFSHDIHRGHILCRDFKSFLPKNIDLILNKKNLNNIYPQFACSNYRNCISEGRRGQYHFEEKVKNALESGGKIYYEVEVYLKNETDNIPRGTRILAKGIGETEFEVFHVFIPNYHEFNYRGNAQNNFSYELGFRA